MEPTSARCRDCHCLIPPDEIYCDDCKCSGCGSTNMGNLRGLCDDCREIQEQVYAEDAGEW